MSDEARLTYASDAEVESLVARFESCELPPAEVSHRVHVAMSAWCFLKLPAPQAAARICDGLRRYVERHQIKIYNETITWFWIKQVGKAVAGLDAGRPAFALVNEVMARLGDSRLIFTYYTRERLQTAEARRQWVEPDLQPLDV
jgi:hypothetical protein